MLDAALKQSPSLAANDVATAVTGSPEPSYQFYSHVLLTNQAMATYNRMRADLQRIQQKIQELEASAEEHKYCPSSVPSSL